MDIPLNLLAVALAAVSTMIVGTIWYRPKVFGDRFMALTGVDPNKPKRPGLVYGGSFVASIVTALVLAGTAGIVEQQLQLGSIPTALLTAAALWAGFTAARVLVHELFEGRDGRIFLITAGHELVTALVMGVIIGALGL